MEKKNSSNPKLLWKGIEKSYETMCELSKRLRIHRPRTKFIDVQKANLAFRNVSFDSVCTINAPTPLFLPLRGVRGAAHLSSARCISGRSHRGF